MRKLSNTEAELKKSVAYKKKHVGDTVCILRSQTNSESRDSIKNIDVSLGT